MNVTVRNNLAASDLKHATEGMAVLTAANTLTQLVTLAQLTIVNGVQQAAASFTAAQLAAPIKYNKLWIYPAKSVAASGQPVLNGATIWVGKSKLNTLDMLLTGDLPLKYEWLLGQCGDLRDIYLSGAIGDGVFFTS